MRTSDCKIGDIVRVARRDGPDMWMESLHERFLGVTGTVAMIRPEIWDWPGAGSGLIILAFEHGGQKWGGFPFPPWNLELVCRLEDIPPPPPPPPYVKPTWYGMLWNILTTPL